MPQGSACACFFKGSGQGFDQGAGFGERGFQRLSALEAGEFFVFQTLDLDGGEVDFVLDGVGLDGVLDRVVLGAEARGLLAMGFDFAVQASAERVFAAQRRGGCLLYTSRCV